MCWWGLLGEKVMPQKTTNIQAWIWDLGVLLGPYEMFQ